mmetsp:Transcript_27553/g.66741  ORF Transcript_27553/g.66741 Transcript_27553/m.66741 type:complete len:97 (+) Transcript_27553:212-502(+)
MITHSCTSFNTANDFPREAKVERRVNMHGALTPTYHQMTTERERFGPRYHPAMIHDISHYTCHDEVRQKRPTKTDSTAQGAVKKAPSLAALCHLFD